MLGFGVRRHLAALGAAIALVATGCGSSVTDDARVTTDSEPQQNERDAQPGSDGGTPSESSKPDRPSNTDKPSNADMPPKQPKVPPARPGPNPPTTIAIDSAKPLSDDRMLRVRYLIGQPACDGSLGEVEVRETARVVSVTLHRDPPPNKGKAACILRLDTKTTDVRLDAPLGGRAVIDAPHHTKVPREPQN